MHLKIFFSSFPPVIFLSLQLCKSSPCNFHLATHASDHLKAFHSFSSLFKGVVIIIVVMIRSAHFIFSGSCRPPPQGFLYGSWQQLQLYSHRDNCACRNIGGYRRKGCHSDSRILKMAKAGKLNKYKLAEKGDAGEFI